MPLLSNDGRCRRIMAFFVESSERHESQRNKKAKACSLVARFGFYLLWVWLLHLSDRKRETLKSPLAK